MTLYKFYRYPEDSVRNMKKLDSVKKYPLYAFTRYKKVADEFIRTRKSKLFVYIKTKDVSEEEYIEFAKKYRGFALEYKTVESYVRSNNIKLDYDILMTTNEYNNIESMIDSNLYIDDTFPYVDVDIFTRKAMKKIKRIEYTNIVALFNNHIDFDFIGANDSDYQYDDLVVDWEYDTFRLFISTYGELLNLDEFLKNIK